MKMQREGATNILIILVSASINALIFGPSHRGTCAFCIWTSIKITVSLKVREKRTFITLSLQCIWYPGSKSKKAKKKNKITKYSFASLHNLQILLSCDRSPSIKTRKMQRKSFILLFTFVQFRSVPLYPCGQSSTVCLQYETISMFSLSIFSKNKTHWYPFTQRSAKKIKTYQKIDICAKLTKVLNIPFEICDSSKDRTKAVESILEIGCHKLSSSLRIEKKRLTPLPWSGYAAPAVCNYHLQTT